MKKQKINTILLPIVLLLWSVLFLKFFGVLPWGKKTTAPTFTQKSDTTLSTLKKEKKEFEILRLSKDPFLKKTYTPSPKKTQAPKKTKTVQKIKKDKPIQWPSISYNGFIRDNSKKTKLLLIKINDQIHRAREYETIGEITIGKAYKDSLEIKYAGQTKHLLIP